MITETLVSIILVSVMIIMLATLIPFGIGLIRTSKGNITAVFLVFYYTILLFVLLFWLIYDIMLPDARMPFAANEIGEFTMFFMQAAIINSLFESRPESKLLLVGSIFFTAVNVVLWWSWSGEWIQDIITGVAFAWVMYSIARALWGTRTLSKRAWVTISVMALMCVLCQALTFFVGETAGAVLETVGYGFVSAGIVFFALQIYRTAVKEKSSRSFLILVVALTIWIIMGEYMSAGIWYNSFMGLRFVVTPLLFVAARRVVREA